MFKKIIVFFILFATFYIPINTLGAGFPICDPCCQDSQCDDGLCAGVGSSCDLSKKVDTGTCQPKDTTKVVFCNLSRYGEIHQVVDEVTKWIFTLSLVLAPLMILLGGFYMLTSRGDPKMSNTGKEIIKWSIIGLAVILFAKAFVAIVTKFLK